MPGAAPYAPGADVDAYLLCLGNMQPPNAAQDSYLQAFYFTDSAGTNYVAVPPGTQQGWIADNAANNEANTSGGYDPSNLYSNQHPNLAFGSMGPAPDITLGGFIANGCHGTGWEEPTVSDLVYGIEVMTVDENGEVLMQAYTVNQELAGLLQGVTESTPQVAPEMMQALRVSLGALGVITKLVFRLEPLFNVAHLDEYADVETIFPASGDTTNLETLVTSCDYLEIFWFPYIGIDFFGWSPTNQVWVKRYSKTQDPVKNPDRVTTFTEITSVMASLTGGLLGSLFAKVPSATPITLWTFFESLKLLMGEREMKDPDFKKDYGQDPNDPVVPVNIAYLYQLKYFTNLIDLSYTVPITQTQADPPQYDFSKVLTAWQDAVNQIQTMSESGQYPVSLNVHLRFVKNSDSLLSPANHPSNTTHTCYIEFLSFSQQLDGFATYSQTVGAQWAALGGLPHWAKIFQLVPDAYADSRQKLQDAGHLQPFLDIRQQLDPNGIFMNDFLNELLNGETATAARPTTARVAAAAQAYAEAAYDDPQPSQQFPLASPQVLERLSAPAGGQGLPKSPRGCSLVHDSKNGGAVLLDENAAGHLMRYDYDTAAGQITYTLLTPSQTLSPDEVFQRVGEVLEIGC